MRSSLEIDCRSEQQALHFSVMLFLSDAAGIPAPTNKKIVILGSTYTRPIQGLPDWKRVQIPISEFIANELFEDHQTPITIDHILISSFNDATLDIARIALKKHMR